MDDVLNDALSNLEHDNYEISYKGYENRQADIALIRAALAAQPAASAEPSDMAHEIWAAAQLAPGEGIEDGAARVEALLSRYGSPAGDAKNAERWRWLRVQPFEVWKRIAWNTWGDDPAVATHRDAAIDAAISAQPAANSDLTSFDDYWRRFWALCGRLASQQNKEE